MSAISKAYPAAATIIRSACTTSAPFTISRMAISCGPTTVKVSTCQTRQVLRQARPERRRQPAGRYQEPPGRTRLALCRLGLGRPGGAVLHLVGQDHQRRLANADHQRRRAEEPRLWFRRCVDPSLPERLGGRWYLAPDPFRRKAANGGWNKRDARYASLSKSTAFGWKGDGRSARLQANHAFSLKDDADHEIDGYTTFDLLGSQDTGFGTFSAGIQNLLEAVQHGLGAACDVVLCTDLWASVPV
ncbi:Cloacin receptor [Pseudomonas sp. IsoF]|nr:Cloacin receptor [Pseudomonas sp. IsoF]